MRAACALASKVVATRLPIWVLGRHEKSSGCQVLRPRGETSRTDWDWDFEVPDPWHYCPFQFKSVYATLSLDAALSVKNLLPDILGHIPINWLMWTKYIHDGLLAAVRNKQLPSETWDLFAAGLRRLPWKARALWWLRHRYPNLERCRRNFTSILRHGHLSVPPKGPAGPLSHAFGWPYIFHGERAGIHNITDVPTWVEKVFFGFFPPTATAENVRVTNDGNTG